LLEIAEKRARSRGLKNFRTQKADAHSLPFPDDSFDVGTSRFGVMFFRDPSKALGELRRVLRPGARACFLAWGSFDQPYWKSMMGVVHRNVGGPLLPPDGPNPFRFADPRSLSETLRLAGFGSVEEQSVTLPWAWPGPPFSPLACREPFWPLGPFASGGMPGSLPALPPGSLPDWPGRVSLPSFDLLPSAPCGPLDF
jgi:SAM-dependent methyltransferase